MKIVVLDAETLGNDISLDPIKELGDCVVYGGTKEEELDDRIKDAEVIVLNKVKIRKETIENARKLKLICVAATGYDNIDVEYCRKRNVGVSNVVGYSSHSVAQVTLAMVLALSVNLSYYTDYVKNGDYTKSGVANKVTPVYHELFGKVWGIVGCGNIGKEVAAVAKALGCSVIVNKKNPVEEFECISLDELCRRADIISIHTPLTEVTKGMIDREKLAMMKKDVILVNAARGAVTEEEAVAEAIKNGEIGGFGTDVYSVEPFGKDHPFYEIKDMENVCLTPHMAWGSFEARNRCINEMAENIKAFKNNIKRNRVDL